MRMPLANIGVIRNLLGAFLFSGDSVDKRIENIFVITKLSLVFDV